MGKVLLFLCVFVIIASMIKYLIDGDIHGAAGIGLSAYLLLDEIRRVTEKGDED